MLRKKVDVLFLILSVVLGFIYSVAAEPLYLFVTNIIDPYLGFYGGRIIVISLYIIGFALFFGIILLIKGAIGGAFKDKGKVFKYIALFLIALIILTPLFEFLYELSVNIKLPGKAPTSTQYVFLIDDSGSMNGYGDGIGGYDMEGKRYSAVEQILDGMPETRDFAVYNFANNTNCVTPMGSTSSKGYKYPAPHATGNEGTYTMTAIDRVIDDVATEDKGTVIVILTDGDPMDGNLKRSTINKCKENNTALSLVGFGDVNEADMQSLADETGGTFVRAEDANKLDMSLDQVMKSSPKFKLKKSDRDLLGTRDDNTRFNVLYMLLRVLFLVLLGAIWAALKTSFIGDKKFTWKSTIISGVCCGIAALICEILFLIPVRSLVGLNYPIIAYIYEWAVRMIFCVLWAVTYIEVPHYISLNDDSFGRIGNVAGGPANNYGDEDSYNTTKTIS